MRVNMHLCLVLLVAVLSPSAASAATPSPKLWGSLQPGRHSVGYLQFYERDGTRIYFRQTDLRGRQILGDRRRPVPIRVWYPAVAGTGHEMRYEQYLTLPTADERVRDVESGYQFRNRAVHKFALQTYAAGADETLLRRLLATVVPARIGATPALGRFPIIVFGGGANHSVDENVVLWEYLASHGFIVAAVPAQHQTTTDFAADAPGLEALTRDMEVALSWARRLPNADADRIGAMGFSYGGAAALLLAMRNTDIAGVAGWDSSITSERFNKGLIASPNYDPGKVRAPLLELRAGDPAAPPGLGDEVIKSLVHADRRSFLAKGAEHIDFNSYSVAIRALAPDSTSAKGWSLEKRSKLYEALARKTLSFFQATVENDPSAKNSLDRSLVAEETVFATVRRLDAKAPVATPEELAELVKRDGLSKTLPLLPPEGSESDERVEALVTISRTGLLLLQWGHVPEAIQMHLINIHRYPEYLGPVVSVAEAYGHAGDRACAIAALKRIIATVTAKGESATELDRSRKEDAEGELARLPRATFEERVPRNCFALGA